MRYLVFTDLDGTLLNHDDYGYESALPALRRLQAMEVPVILTSSKTHAELSELGRLLGIQHPVIYETGCGISWPEDYFDHLQKTTQSFCQPRDDILRLLKLLRDTQGYDFAGFDDLNVEELADRTGLAHDSAHLAKDRHYGEPIQWQDTEARLDQFERAIAESGLHLVRGGRFIHVMSPVSKADAIRWLLKQYQQDDPSTEWVTVGLGDSPNDREMLLTVDRAFLVRNLHLSAEQSELMEIPDIQQTTQCGAKGWNEAISALLDGPGGRSEGLHQ